MSGENDKRRSERLPGRFRVEVRERLVTWGTSTEDVSARGCRIEMRRPLVPGMLVQLAFDMGQGQEPLLAHAQVAWIRREAPASAGFAFLSMPRLPGEAKHPLPGSWIDRLLAACVRSLTDAPRPAAAARATGAAPARAGAAIILPPVG